MTVRDLLERTTSAEITEWMAYESLTGSLDVRLRGDYQAANVASTVYGMLRGKKGKQPRLKDFLIQWGRSHQATTDEDMEALARQLAARVGGEFSEGGEYDDPGEP